MDDIAKIPSPALAPPTVTIGQLARLAYALYIDADNQSAQSAAALIDVLQQGIGGTVIGATVAGNDQGNKNPGWITALREQIPDLPIEHLTVPCRQDAADTALILALGANLAEHRRTKTRVVMVSRDAILLAAAEQAKEAGCRVYVAYADSEIPTARRTALTTFLLPALSGSSARPMHKPVAAVAPAPTATPSEVLKAMQHVHATCPQQPGGGYRATDVGSALAKLGYKTPAARRQLLARFPKLTEQGPAAKKQFFFGSLGFPVASDT